MIALIRIRGMVKIPEEMENTLSKRLLLQRKFACIVIEPTKENWGMIKKVENLVAYGEISDETLKKLIEVRGQIIDKNKAKVSAETVVKGLNEKKKLQDFNLKPFFRLHPPRGGLKSSKDHFPAGILGHHGNEINKLIERML